MMIDRKLLSNQKRPSTRLSTRGARRFPGGFLLQAAEVIVEEFAKGEELRRKGFGVVI